MRVSVVSQGNPIPEKLREYSSERAILSLARYRYHIQTLKLTLEDSSNPRDGLERICRVEVTGEFGKRFIVVHDHNFKSAIDCALGVTNRVIERTLNRASLEMSTLSLDQKLAS